MCPVSAAVMAASMVSRSRSSPTRITSGSCRNARRIASENEVTVAANADGSPAGLYIVSAECLATIPSRGYVDLKEQWLADLRSQGRSIGVHTLPGDGALPLRTSREFIDATRKITPASVVVVSEDASHHDRGPLPQTKPIVVRSSIFPDGSIKTSLPVADGTHTGGRVLSDDSSFSDTRRLRGA